MESVTIMLYLNIMRRYSQLKLLWENIPQIPSGLRSYYHMKLPIGKVTLKLCITWGFYCFDKHHEQVQLEKRRLILLYDL